MKHLAPLLPTISVLLGLHWLNDAWIALGLYHLGMVLCLVFFGGRNLLPLLLRGRPWVSFPLILACAGGGAILAFGWPWFVEDPGSLAADLAGLGLAGGRWWAFVFYYALVNPVLEELFWRGWLAPATKRPHWHDLAFATYHGVVLVFFIQLPWIFVCVAVLIAAAWAWRWMVRTWGGLFAPAASHLVADVGIVAAAQFLAGLRP